MVAPDPLVIGSLLRETAALHRLTGENAFKANAYEAAARAVESLGASIADIALRDGWTDVPGVGNAIASQIRAMLASGTSPVLEKLRASLPSGAAALAKIPKLTLRRMIALRDALGIDSVESLERACEEHRVRAVKGFGAKTEAALLEGIQSLANAKPEAPQGMLLLNAIDLAERLATFARSCAGVERVEVAGEVRRWKEIINQLDVVVASATVEQTVAALARYPESSNASLVSADHLALHVAPGFFAHAHVVTPQDFTLALFRATGTFEHVGAVESLQADMGPPPETELAIYESAHLPFIPPELRENDGEIEKGRAGDDFHDLLAIENIRGMLHCHTTYSDGRNTILEMARAAEALGMQYVTITDHSPTAHYAGGVTIDRLKQQWDEIAKAQEQVSVRILRGTESDILADGFLDYPDAILEQLDVVIASIHSRYKMDEAAMTARIVHAMKQPVFKIWGHALGRLVLHRPPIPCRMEEILDVIAESRAAIEVNGDPYRLDMPPEWLRRARERNIRFAISVDAHSTRGMQNLKFGVEMARRGGLRRGEVLNALPTDDFRRAVRPGLTGETSDPHPDAARMLNAPSCTHCVSK